MEVCRPQVISDPEGVKALWERNLTDDVREAFEAAREALKSLTEDNQRKKELKRR